MNIVPTSQTRAVAQRMHASVVHNSGPDAVLRHLREVSPQQIPALVGLILTNTRINQKPGRPPIPNRLTDEQRRAGYAAYKRGDRTPEVVEAFREYQRIQQRRQRARGKRPVDGRFTPSVAVATMKPGHDNKSAPDGAATPRPGASPTEIGHDRLMGTVPPRPDSAPEAACPACGAPGEGKAREERGVVRADYLCAAGHIWRTSWPQGGAA